MIGASLILAAAVWYPADTWRDEPDVIASAHAKKGGTIRFSSSSPKSFNYYIDNNSATEMMFSLMYSPLISTDTDTLEFVPHLARRWCVDDENGVYTFVIDEEARWSDGEPVTAVDVKWTFDQIMDPKSETGAWKVMLGTFESPEILDADSPRPLKIRFTRKRRPDGRHIRNWRDLLHCGNFPIMPSHYFAGQDFNKLDLVGAPTCGPYKIGFTQEQVMTSYDRVKDWWRKDRPSCLGVFNFDRIVLRYYIDPANAFAAIKKDIIDVYPVYSARIMATETLGEKFEHNWLVKRRVANHEPIGYQGFAMNMRRWPFDDLRVRKAMAKLIDREFMNNTMMYNEYFLQKSYYGDLYDDKHQCTNELVKYDFEGAKNLLTEAGFAVNPATKKLEKEGRPFAFTFLSRGKSEDKFLAVFVSRLEELGIDMKIVRKDFAGWMRDMNAFNFDMTWQSWNASIFRNPEVSWLSTEADREQSNNTTGFKSAEVDRIIEAEKTMRTMAEREEAYRQIDALVAAQAPYAFLWNIDSTRLVYWNRFGMPATILSRTGNEADVLAYWWFDEDRNKELEKAVKEGLYLPSVPERVEYDAVIRAGK